MSLKMSALKKVRASVLLGVRICAHLLQVEHLKVRISHLDTHAQDVFFSRREVEVLQSEDDSLSEIVTS